MNYINPFRQILPATPDDDRTGMSAGRRGMKDANPVSPISDVELTPEGKTIEFVTKQFELAGHLFSVAYGGTWTVSDILADPSYGLEYAQNYMQDAEDLLILMPHLLTLETREAMRIGAGQPLPRPAGPTRTIAPTPL